ncbi:RNA-binding protein RO60 [Macrosteles quadrilineatus]|uniref:RNA-binding protein RO60 n=1 Tax=Macrosteles quadrilineatus TaxID=74068 RepID=UPI0023E13D24|nr:RNA-binding protein RO60 [Macrosteles quadrilineatus]
MSDQRDLLEMRFKRYLHYGSEQPIYKPGDRFHHKSYTEENIPSLKKLIEEDEPEKLIDTMVKVKTDGTSLWPDAIIFAYAYCVCSNKVVLQNAAYKVIRKVCRSPNDITLFVKFYRELRGSKGGGNGFKKAIASWYLVWMPFDLADILFKQKRYHGWTHLDVLRLAHVKPVTIEQTVLLKYAIKGAKRTTEQYKDSDNEQVKELLEYMNSVESFRRVSDPEEAAKRVGRELHNIERVPSGLLKYQEVWNQLIPNMDVRTLLENLQRISIHGFLKGNNITVMSVMDVFNNMRKAEEFKGHPVRVYIELMTYEKAAKYCLDIASKMGHPISKITPARKPPKINLMIKNALMTFYLTLHKFQKPTNLRYFVAVDVRSKMTTDRCHGCMHLTPLEAAAAVCLSLTRVESESNITIGTFSEEKGDIDVHSFTKDSEIAKFETTFSEKSETAGPASVVAAIHWADVKKKPYDVFIILSNYTVLTSGTRVAIQKYRTDMNLPNAKVVTCSLTGNLRTHKDVEGQNMLCVIGFDEHVPRLIEAFAKGAF